MNQTNNGYCAFNRNGSSRGPSHSTSAFKQAWRRATLILRGGPVADIDAKLAKLHLPAAATPDTPTAGAAGGDDCGCRRPRGRRTRTPTARGRTGREPKYVDWVGTDFYSKFPNFTDLETFYNDFPNKPFVFGEWAMWGSDDAAFVRRFFSFVDTHKRVRMLLYNQGNLTGGPFRLNRYPNATAGDQAGAEEEALPRAA